ncbi:putative terpene synthase 6, partial [Mucuna pruriens]
VFDLIKSYMIEAKWCDEGFIPTYDEYKANGVLTSTFLLMITSFIGLGELVEYWMTWAHISYKWINEMVLIQIPSMQCTDTCSGFKEKYGLSFPRRSPMVATVFHRRWPSTEGLNYQSVSDTWSVLSSNRPLPKHRSCIHSID